MVNGFYGFGSYGGSKPKYRKLSRRELTDRLIYLEERFLELAKEKYCGTNKSDDDSTSMIVQMLDVSNIETKLKLNIINTVDEKIKEHINAYHNKGDK